MCKWDYTIGRCSFFNEDDGFDEVEWLGEFEVGQTHVVKATGETRHAPRIIAHREAELLFTPAGVRKVGGGSSETTSDSEQPERIESIGTVYLVKGGKRPVLDAGAQQLIDGSDKVFSLPNDIKDIDIIVDLESSRIIEQVSIALQGGTTVSTAKLGLHHDDGANQEEGEGFRLPPADWMWIDFSSAQGGGMAVSIRKRRARYVIIRLEGGESESLARWGFRNIEIEGSIDGFQYIRPTTRRDRRATVTRSIDSDLSTTSRTFTPSTSAYVRVAIYSSAGQLVGAMKARSPTQQRDIMERRLSLVNIPDYSDLIWSATLPYNWVKEGNIVLIGCVDDARPSELLVHRLELSNLAQFSEHSITR